MHIAMHKKPMFCVKHKRIDGSSYTITPHPGSPGDYDAVVNGLLTFNVGEVSKTHRIFINQDFLCENDPNEDFFSIIELESGIQPIIVRPSRAQVIIDDSMEPDCGK